MYGACERVVKSETKQVLVHNLLKKQGVWSGEDADAKECLTK